MATYSYDRVHNRTDNGATLQTSSNRYAAFGGYTLGYDNKGNLTSRTATGYSQTYTWNDLGQLASVTTNGTTVSYLYNGFGKRVKRTQGSAVSWSIYDGDDLLLELDGSGDVLREYTMYPGIDAPHSLRVWSGATPGSANYYVMEQPGHVTGLVNSSSQVANQYQYTPWGQPESTTETIAQPLRFMARELEAATGLYYVRARWYDPALARCRRTRRFSIAWPSFPPLIEIGCTRLGTCPRAFVCIDTGLSPIVPVREGEMRSYASFVVPAILEACASAQPIVTSAGHVPPPGIAASDTTPRSPAIVDTDQTLFPDLIDRTSFRMEVVRRQISLYLEQQRAIPERRDLAFPEPESEWITRYGQDAWGTKLRYTPAHADHELRSAGPDGRFGTQDDIVVTRRVGTRWADNP